jgi:hypothetical protein
MDGPRLVATVLRIGVIVFLGLTYLMWKNNIEGNSGVNFKFALGGFFLTFFVFVSPKATVPWLGVRTVSQETATEIKQALLKILLSFMLTAIFLATWSFQASPDSFWVLFTLLLALLTWQLIHKGDTEITKKLQLGYILICIALVLLKTMGVDLASKVDATTLENLPVWCMDGVPPLVHAGARLTVEAGCTLQIDQRRMSETGVDFVLVDPELRAAVGRSELFALGQPEGSNLLSLIPNREGFARFGLESVEVEVYPRGTGSEEAARRYGVHIPEISLTPAR